MERWASKMKERPGRLDDIKKQTSGEVCCRILEETKQLAFGSLDWQRM